MSLQHALLLQPMTCVRQLPRGGQIGLSIQRPHRHSVDADSSTQPGLVCLRRAQPVARAGFSCSRARHQLTRPPVRRILALSQTLPRHIQSKAGARGHINTSARFAQWAERRAARRTRAAQHGEGERGASQHRRADTRRPTRDANCSCPELPGTAKSAGDKVQGLYGRPLSGRCRDGANRARSKAGLEGSTEINGPTLRERRCSVFPARVPPLHVRRSPARPYRSSV